MGVCHGVVQDRPPWVKNATSSRAARFGGSTLLDGAPLPQ